MMISPETYIREQKDKAYDELIIERNKLIDSIKDFETRNDKVPIIINPSPEVRYQCNLLYLSKLCELISEKYNKDINKIVE